MPFKITAVVGAGTMGSGIAHVLSLNGYKVQLCDIDKAILEKALDIISKNMDRQIKKNIIDENGKNEALKRIEIIDTLDKISPDTDIVVEAVVEKYEVKTNIYNQLTKILKQEAIIASNTSSISITALAPKERAANFIGMHFMNPVPVMKLVEVVRGYETSDETTGKVIDLAKKLGKIPVEVNDYPGFISNRVLIPMINEAIFAFYEGVAAAESIDSIMKLGMNHPMGPLELADFIGLDVCLSIMEVLYEGYNDSKYRPCPLLKKMVSAGKLGRKSGEGFYKYK
ncbi:3-hydroxyacyl-CoA dehydrogenase nad-binding protein [Melioribacter roseus P3M-2]|uniref:3-hydroxyacyl-CoA dehydrogenase nad-binding protein n=1 Tax=Melioribacter roseus (strain DSM 23840 / JCM 17771 / VKM B-2668 / P3M-2) TaxID=1191523 RepID=I7A7A4_MELRP|nr:3-hydroxybutyryl-CoA dehydrogenase [Melioribacter roseus]AFN75766.1 3-hydroxyacyl-CoA dehydrogenase nad-binding protein [Melioribacter roseus P3M-2]